MPAPLPEVCIIDDDPVFSAVAEMLLFSLGVKTVRRVENDARDIRNLATAGRDCLAIVNLNMRGLDGLAVLRTLSEAGYEGSVAISSGETGAIRDSAARLAKLLGLRFAGELQKPLREADLKLLLEAMRRAAPVAEGDLMSPALKVDFKGIKPVYQPKVDALTAETVGAETLMRVELANGELMSPYRHIERLTREGKMSEETLKFLDLVLIDLVDWQSKGLFPVVSFNAPAPVIEHPEFLVDFAAKVRASGVSPSQITIELTEGVLPQEPAQLLEVLTRLRMAGFGLALDDFGTGMANFDLLRMCPFSELKIDRSLSQAAVHDALSCGIIETCATVSRELGMTLVAEGIETDEQEVTLRRLGVGVFQGFLFGKGMEKADFEQLLLSEAGGEPKTALFGKSR